MREAASLRPGLKDFFNVAKDLAIDILASLQHIKEAQTKSRKVSALWALTDDELKARGMRREDIIRLVLADVV